jgi:hypothetical protein
MDIYLVFHVSLLDPIYQEPLLGPVIHTPEPVIVEGEPEYKAEEVLNSQIFRCQL